MHMRMKLAPSFLVLLSVLGVLPAPRSHGTTLARLSLDQLARHADAVARVRCTGSESRWDNGTIWTVTTVRIVETLKGSPPAQIAIRLPGGQVGGIRSAVDGTPKFRPGEEAFLFLERSPAGGFTVAGWVQGTFRVSRDRVTGAETVTQDSGALAVFDAASRAFRSEGIRLMPVKTFRERVAGAVARGSESAR